MFYLKPLGSKPVELLKFTAPLTSKTIRSIYIKKKKKKTYPLLCLSARHWIKFTSGHLSICLPASPPSRLAAAKQTPERYRSSPAFEAPLPASAVPKSPLLCRRNVFPALPQIVTQPWLLAAGEEKKHTQWVNMFLLPPSLTPFTVCVYQATAAANGPEGRGAQRWSMWQMSPSIEKLSRVQNLQNATMKGFPACLSPCQSISVWFKSKLTGPHKEPKGQQPQTFTLPLCLTVSMMVFLWNVVLVLCEV